MATFDWKSTVAKVAPGLANMLAGPFAGMATTALCGLFGLDPTSGDLDKDLAAAVYNMTPDQAIEMRRIEADLAIKMRQLDHDIFKTETEDIADARRQHKDAKTPAIITYLLIIGAIIVVCFIFTMDMSTKNETLIGAVVGYVFGELRQATAFWLGSSYGSQQKTAGLMNKITSKGGS